MGRDGVLHLEGQLIVRESAREGGGAEPAVLVGLGGLAEARRGDGIKGDAEAEQVVEHALRPPEGARARRGGSRRAESAARGRTRSAGKRDETLRFLLGMPGAARAEEGDR